MSPTTHLGRKFDADSISGIRMDVRARLGVRLEVTRPSALFCMGRGPIFEFVAAVSCFLHVWHAYKNTIRAPKGVLGVRESTWERPGRQTWSVVAAPNAVFYPFKRFVGLIVLPPTLRVSLYVYVAV